MLCGQVLILSAQIQFTFLPLFTKPYLDKWTGYFEISFMKIDLLNPIFGTSAILVLENDFES